MSQNMSVVKLVDYPFFDYGALPQCMHLFLCRYSLICEIDFSCDFLTLNLASEFTCNGTKGL